MKPSLRFLLRDAERLSDALTCSAMCFLRSFSKTLSLAFSAASLAPLARMEHVAYSGTALSGDTGNGCHGKATQH